MRNFIRFNIDNVKGKPRASSLIDHDSRKDSPTKPKFNNNVGRRPYINETMPQKIKRLQGELTNLRGSRNETNQIMEEITQIKQDIKMIKSYLFTSKKSTIKMPKYAGKNQFRNSDGFMDDDEQETIYTHNNNNNNNKQRLRSHGSEGSQFRNHGHQNSQGSSPPKRIYKLEEIINQKLEKSNIGISLKSIFSAVKDYKIEGPEFGTIFFGYMKRNSQPVALKYFEGNMNTVIQVYERLWKNIAKASWPCINRLYDIKSQESNFIVMEKNKSSIIGLPAKNVLIDIIKIIEFIHECGYLYRNVEPEHFMLNQEGQLVAIDMKRAMRYIDIKGHNLEVCDSLYTGSPFASNSQVRCMSESRKDDLESIGYLALLLLEMEIPWAGMGRDQVIRVRSGLTLQQLYRNRPQWVQYMAYVMRLQKHERPDYKYLISVISDGI